MAQERGRAFRREEGDDQRSRCNGANPHQRYRGCNARPPIPEKRARGNQISMRLVMRWKTSSEEQHTGTTTGEERCATCDVNRESHKTDHSIGVQCGTNPHIESHRIGGTTSTNRGALKARTTLKHSKLVGAPPLLREDIEKNTSRNSDPLTA